jgi:hypothetical protein
MKALGGRGGIAPTIVDLGSRWRWVVSVTPRPRFSPGERTPGTHCTGGWVGPRAGLDTEVRGKILCPCRGSNRDRPARSQTLYCLSYPVSPFLFTTHFNIIIRSTARSSNCSSSFILTFYEHCSSFLHVTRSNLHLLTPIVFGKEHKLWSFTIRNFLSFYVIFSFLVPCVTVPFLSSLPSLVTHELIPLDIGLLSRDVT